MPTPEEIKDMQLDNLYQYLLENPNQVVIASVTLDIETGKFMLNADPSWTEEVNAYLKNYIERKGA